MAEVGRTQDGNRIAYATRTVANHRITATQICTPFGEEPYWEITITDADDPEAWPITVITRNEGIAGVAAALEGSAARVAVT